MEYYSKYFSLLHLLAFSTLSIFFRISYSSVIEECDRTATLGHKHSFSVSGGVDTNDPEVKASLSPGGKAFFNISKMIESNKAINCEMNSSGKKIYSLRDSISLVNNRLKETEGVYFLPDFVKQQAALMVRLNENTIRLRAISNPTSSNEIIDFTVKEEKRLRAHNKTRKNVTSEENDFANKLLSGITGYKALLQEADDALDAVSRYRSTGVTPESAYFSCSLICRTYDHNKKIDMGTVRIKSLSLKASQRDDLNALCIQAGGGDKPRDLSIADRLERPGRLYVDTFDCRAIN